MKKKQKQTEQEILEVEEFHQDRRHQRLIELIFESNHCYSKLFQVKDYNHTRLLASIILLMRNNQANKERKKKRNSYSSKSKTKTKAIPSLKRDKALKKKTEFIPQIIEIIKLHTFKHRILYLHLYSDHYHSYPQSVSYPFP